MNEFTKMLDSKCIINVTRLIHQIGRYIFFA